MAGKIEITFSDNEEAEFLINVDMDAHIMVAIMGLEGYLGRQTGLGATEIRELIDDEKKHATARAIEAEVV